MTITLTDDERAVLWAMHPQDLHELAVSPAYEIERMRAGDRSGGSIVLSYRCTKTAYEREWYGEPTTVQRGNHEHLQRGPLLRAARITYKRLQRWIESLPIETRIAIRDTAGTPDLDRLRADLLGPEPRLPTRIGEPAPIAVDDQYALF